MILIIAAILLAAAFSLQRLNFWRREGLKLQQSGYLPPKSGWIADRVFQGLTRLLIFLTVGPVKVIGRQNASYRGRLLVVPNHTYQFDFAMVASSLPFTFRYLADSKELTGIRAPFAAWTGAFGVDTKAEGSGEAVIRSSVNSLSASQNSRLLIFPQGKMVKDNVLRPEEFRTGAVRILRQAAEQCQDQSAALLPVAIHYKRDARSASWFHKVLLRLGLSGFRKAFGMANFGGTVVIGEPIPVRSLPDDPHQATELMRSKINSLLRVAQDVIR